jgi:hypothetical protein
MAAGEGFETMASLRTVMPGLPVAAATSANHLSGLTLPPGCRRLYIAADADAAGRHGIERLSQRAGEARIVAMVLARNSATSTTTCAISARLISLRGCAISSSRTMPVFCLHPDEGRSPTGG